MKSLAVKKGAWPINKNNLILHVKERPTTVVKNSTLSKFMNFRIAKTRLTRFFYSKYFFIYLMIWYTIHKNNWWYNLAPVGQLGMRPSLYYVSKQRDWVGGGVRDIHIECSKQFKWNLYFYGSGQSGPFWAELKLP